MQQLHTGGAVVGRKQADHAGDNGRVVLLHWQARANLEDGGQHHRAAAACNNTSTYRA